MSGPFVILNFLVNGDGKQSEPPTVYMDGYTGALYLDRPQEVERYSTAFKAIWHSALTESASRDLLNRASKELGDERSTTEQLEEKQPQQGTGEVR